MSLFNQSHDKKIHETDERIGNEVSEATRTYIECTKKRTRRGWEPDLRLLSRKGFLAFSCRSFDERKGSVQGDCVSVEGLFQYNIDGDGMESIKLCAPGTNPQEPVFGYGRIFTYVNFRFQDKL